MARFISLIPRSVSNDRNHSSAAASGLGALPSTVIREADLRLTQGFAMMRRTTRQDAQESTRGSAGFAVRFDDAVVISKSKLASAPGLRQADIDQTLSKQSGGDKA